MLGVRNSGGQGPLARAVPCSHSVGRNNEVRGRSKLTLRFVRSTNLAC